jgi:hypothetical protein
LKKAIKSLRQKTRFLTYPKLSLGALPFLGPLAAYRAVDPGCHISSLLYCLYSYHSAIGRPIDQNGIQKNCPAFLINIKESSVNTQQTNHRTQVAISKEGEKDEAILLYIKRIGEKFKA